MKKVWERRSHALPHHYTPDSVSLWSQTKHDYNNYFQEFNALHTSFNNNKQRMLVSKN